MFKKGPVVRSANTREFYLVGSDETPMRCCTLARIASNGVGPFSYQRPRRGLQLIGNNYKAK